ncbi:aggrecan core protein-like isoform X2 [Erinaceus europaeus]|uniref:Aggrecan core protein-like isoform X2 n=1 Tax=Erinaceus europaeus TaxID=9365 RepID=A0ABM3WLD3_ERIEU|nr:aggrecan core protein-like isoform X2 [Erinaceus europaeus]
MDDVVYGNMGRGLWEDPTVSRQKCRSPAPSPCAEGTSGPQQCWGRRTVLVALGLSATAVLCVIILSVLLARGSCQLCPTWWLPAQGSCYFFSQGQATWAEAQRLCLASEAHLVVVGDLEEQNFLKEANRDHSYWLGLKAIRHSSGNIQYYQWVDGTRLNLRGFQSIKWRKESLFYFLAWCVRLQGSPSRLRLPESKGWGQSYQDSQSVKKKPRLRPQPCVFLFLTPLKTQRPGLKPQRGPGREHLVITGAPAPTDRPGSGKWPLVGRQKYRKKRKWGGHRNGGG